MQRSLALILSVTSLLASPLSGAQPVIAEPQQLLPPELPWQGASESLLYTHDDWQTPAEQMALKDTPNYQQTMAFIQRLVAHSDHLHLTFIGKSAQGRDIPLVVASKEGVRTSSELNKIGKPTLLAQAGIHSGEIDGKDAGLMLLRDIALGNKLQLLDNANLLFVPIFNVDGHERRSIYNRVNQRGPVNMGWRTTAQNLNLNRDFAKADTPEMAAMLALFKRWQPDLHLDLHVTDGVDYQYDITYGFTGQHGNSPKISQWLSSHFSPTVDKDLADQGHVPGPLVFAMDKRRMEKGIAGWTAGPRYSDGYGDTRHLATVLVENHSLKPYKQRVLGTYVLLESTLKLLGEHGQALQQASRQDQQQRPAKQILSWEYDKPVPMTFKGVEYAVYQDSASGTEQVRWLGKNKTYEGLPVFPKTKPGTVVDVPKAYWLMPEEQQVIERLHLHGVHLETLKIPTTKTLEQLSTHNAEFGKTPYEGRMRVKADFSRQQQQIALPKGAIRVSTDQPLGRLVVSLLEPQGPDSFFQWGFFNTIFQRTEYIEGYVVAPMARQMLDSDPALKSAFNKKLAEDKDFASDAKARLRWFYERSPFYDQHYLKYPVLREL